jgi:hypothetical protein
LLLPGGLGRNVRALVGSTIVAFLACTDWMHAMLFSDSMPVWMRPLIPAVAALIAGYLLLRVFPDARGSGIPQTTTALIARGGHISLRTVIGKFFCYSLSLDGGIALGREGPSVQIGAGVASFLARKDGLEKREVQALVPIGAAAALVAAHAPHFFPPRFEVVVEEQDADGLPSHTRNQAPLDGFLRYQTDRPAGAAFGRVAAHHSDNPLLLTVIQHRGSAGALLLEQRGFQTAPLVTAADGANGLRGERDDSGNPRRTGASRQLQ